MSTSQAPSSAHRPPGSRLPADKRPSHLRGPQGPARPVLSPPRAPPPPFTLLHKGLLAVIFQHARFSPAPGPLHGLFSPPETTFPRPLQGLLPCFSQYLAQTSPLQISCSPDHLTPECPPNSRPLSPPSGFLCLPALGPTPPVYHLSMPPVTGHQVCPATCRAVCSAQGSVPQRGAGGLRRSLCDHCLPGAQGRAAPHDSEQMRQYEAVEPRSSTGARAHSLPISWNGLATGAKFPWARAPRSLGPP